MSSLEPFFPGSRSLVEFTFRVGVLRLGAALTTSGLLIGFKRRESGWFVVLGRWS